MVNILTFIIVVTISFCCASPHLGKRQDLAVADYTCAGVGSLPEKGCYPAPGKLDTTAPQAWGVYLDKAPESQLTAEILPNLADTCQTPMSLMCRYVERHIGDASVRAHWIWAISPGPGCLVATYLPVVNPVPDPTYVSCYQYIDQPMRVALYSGASQGYSRVSINVREFPTLPDLLTLVNTATNGPTPVDPTSAGYNVNASLSSWFMQA